MAEEGLKSTEHQKIFIAKPSSITMEELEQKLEKCRQTIENENISIKEVKQNIKEIVPTYKENNK